MSVKIHEKISIGLGLNYQLSNFHLIKWDGQEIENLAQQAFGITITDYYLRSEYKLSNNGFAFFTGIQAQVSESVLLGFVYQGSHNSESSGNLDYQHKSTEYTDLDPLVKAAFPDGDMDLVGRTNVNQFTFGLALILNNQFDCEVNYNYKLWSQLKTWKYSLSKHILQEDLSYTNEGEVPWKWQDSESWRIGGEYHINQFLDVRIGLSINSSPIPDEGLMSVVPNSSHWDIHLGMGYKMNNYVIDIGYVHKFYKKRVNMAWYGMTLKEIQGSLFAVSLGREI